MNGSVAKGRDTGNHIDEAYEEDEENSTGDLADSGPDKNLRSAIGSSFALAGGMATAIVGGTSTGMQGEALGSIL